ncbi:enoyl-[acyl-carrier-protein] reductase, mitochondrial [Lingula anatina]|uniref:Enoyl-[acyl-carrier-protein] reductase, mitochondrial n=1 Tax=Lingula anatina TaxID=7574 RepID=A0A1S3K0S2_LINAN|nr:enoyl-[acyl-carrier-protein] reductase, mitochondrial [Lingula anatina]|eukprot:XP_013416240.1 enoyl-[acyl-carrier-protein] reductase, mitochondrial [Lingula anatina]
MAMRISWVVSSFKNIGVPTVRRLSSAPGIVSKITYNEYGDPSKVLRLSKGDILQIQRGEVLVKVLASPVNPADINTIQGVYPIRPPLPAVGGNEGVGEIIEVGAEVQNLKPGDWVLPSRAGSVGTWSTHYVCSPRDIRTVPNDIPVLHAATLAVNPCTAYRMLKDFADLKEGDYVIQNGSNTAVGQAVTQIGKELKINLINVVRNHAMPECVQHHESLGAAKVVSEDFLRSSNMKDYINSLPSKPKLALNCVGGDVATNMIRHLAKGSVMVTYGGLSRKPVTIGTGSLIFSDIRILGFWMSEWNAHHVNSAESVEMINFLCQMIRQKKFKAPKACAVPLENFRDAVINSMSFGNRAKNILAMNEKVLAEINSGEEA